MSAPVDLEFEARRLAEAGRELFRSAGAGGRGVIDCGRDDRGRTMRIVRAPQWAEAYPECPVPAVRLHLEVRDASGCDVTPPQLNPVFVVGLPDGETVADMLREAARLALVPSPDKTGRL